MLIAEIFVLLVFFDAIVFALVISEQARAVITGTGIVITLSCLFTAFIMGCYSMIYPTDNTPITVGIQTNTMTIGYT